MPTEFVEIPQPSVFRLANLFNDNNFVVPLYQRNYAWGAHEVEDFWGDLQDLVEGRHNSHFFGQIVTYKNAHGDQEIIDGQQRLTTSTIFMAAIRDVANQIYHDKVRGSQDEALLEMGDQLRDIRQQVEKAVRGKEHPSLIVQQASANQDQDLQNYFHDLTNGVHKVVTEKLTSEPKENMQRAYKEMVQWIKASYKAEKTVDARIERLQRTFDAFMNKFYIVMISAPSQLDAFTIFETLNSRGKDLRASDIIKNHLMSLMGDNANIKAGNDQWNRLTKPLDDNSDKITRFIRTYWAAKKRIVPEPKLYREISTEINDVNSAQAFLGDLEKLVPLYTVLESPMTPKSHYDFFNNKQIGETLDVLSRLRVKLYYPVLLSMVYKKYSERGILQVANKLLAIFVRHRTIINDGTNKLETGFSDIAHKIWDLELTSVDDIIAELNDRLLPSDPATEASFSVLEKAGGQRGAKRWTLVYLLAELYRAADEDLGDQLYHDVFKNDGYQLVQIGNEAEVGDRVNYVGNWALLEKKWAQDGIQDARSWAPYLKKSALRGNQQLADRIQISGWHAQNVDTRQHEFSQNVTLIW